MLCCGQEAGAFEWRFWAGNRARRAEQARLAADALQVLHGQCFSCHEGTRPKAGLSMADREALLAGGDSGPAVLPRKPDQSLLLQVLSADGDPHMPPKKQLGTNEVGMLRRWIAAGAPWDAQALARLRAPRPVILEPPPPGYQPVLALALAPEPSGGRVAFGRGGTLVVEETSGGTNRRTLGSVPAHRDAVRAVAWSPDGRRIATGGFREVTVRDAETLEVVWGISSNLTGRVTALRFTPHGGALLVGEGGPGGAGWVRVYEAEGGQPLAAWVAHPDSILDLSVSPDGGMLATAGVDRLVKTWELVSHKELARLEGHTGAVTGVAFHPSERELVSVGADRQLKLWDVRTGESVVTIGGRKRGFTSVGWAADGSKVVAGEDGGGVVLFSGFKRHSGEQSSATAQEKRLGGEGGVVHSVAVSGDGKRVAAGLEDGVVRVLDDSGKTLVQLQPPPSEGAPVAGEGPDAAGAVASPSFVRDVLPVLAKAGCSAGACHAKADGQNGFKLSVFSYDPASDFDEIVREGRGRRVFPASPDESLLLLKALGRVEHGGGRRFEPDSETHQLLRRWVRSGMRYQVPGEAALAGIEVEPREGSYRMTATQQLKVLARFADGTTRDVSALAEYQSNEKEFVQVDEHGEMRVGNLGGEGVVVARYQGFVAASRLAVPSDTEIPAERYATLPAHNFIDDLAHAQFRKLGLFPSDLCTDAEFLRRSSLDAVGVLPTEAEARAFLTSIPAEAAPDVVRARRAAWVEGLLARPEFADYWANKWADLLRPNPDRVGVKSVYVLDQWLRDAFRSGKPYDQFVREVLLAEGTNHRDGPVVVYRDRREPPELTTLFSQVFLGVRMECAKCHHHPNEKWSQEDFYRFAAVFGSLKQKGAGLSPPISAGTETFYFGAGGSVRHPVSGAEMTPRAPDGPEWTLRPGEDPRKALVDWLVSPDNPFLARAAVNRVWAVFFGRGFVEPVDDFRVSNPASNEPLLAALAADFSSHGWDLKHLIRTILDSRLYQLSSTPNPHNLADTRNFSRSYRRRLPAEVLLDAVNDITGVGDTFNGCPPGTRATQTWSYKIGSQFLDAFGRPNPSSDCPCERDLRSSVVQSLHLMNSRRLHEKLADPTGLARRLAEDAGRNPGEIVEALYLATLSRPPTPGERETAVAAIGEGAEGRRAGAEDVLWALLNSAEFVFNH